MPGRWIVALSVQIAFVLAFGLALGRAQAAERRVALLVGISQYQDKDIKSLEGPAHDVAAMRDVLVQRWGFKSDDIRTLVDSRLHEPRCWPVWMHSDNAAALATRC